MLIFLTVDRYGSLKLWAHLSLDDKYCKYLINGIGNSTTPPPVTPPSPTTERAQPPSPPSTPRPSQSPSTSPPPSKGTRPSPIPSPREAPIPPRALTPRYDMEGVGKTRRYPLVLLLVTGIHKREIKTQCRRLARIYHLGKDDSESTGMTSYQA